MQTFGKSLIVASALTLVVTAAFAANKKTPEESAAEYRQSTYKMVSQHFGPMVAMIKGEVDYNADVFTKNAQAFQSLAHLAPNGFVTPGVAEGSKAKEAIWENQEDFAAKMKAFQDGADAIAEAATSGDMAVIKPVFAEAAKSCKGCHQEFRNK